MSGGESIEDRILSNKEGAAYAGAIVIRRSAIQLLRRKLFTVIKNGTPVYMRVLAFFAEEKYKLGEKLGKTCGPE